VLTVANDEAACLGAAMLAGSALGLYPSAAAAAEELVRVKARWEPDPSHKAAYDRGYDQYVRLYDSLRQLFRSA
jgi:xylulokinase